MPMPEVNKFAGAYKKALAENPDNQELNNSVAMCYLKLKLDDKALPAFEKAMEDYMGTNWKSEPSSDCLHSIINDGWKMNY